MTRNAKNGLTSRREFLAKGVALGAGAAGLSALGVRRALAAADELRVLFPGGTWQQFFIKTFTDPWAEARGTEFTWNTGLGFEPLVIAQRRRPQWDLIHQNQNTSSQLGALDVILEWTEDRLSNLSGIHPAFRYTHLAGKIHTPYGLAVNTSKITRPITSWWDMWDQEFNGKVGFPDWGWMGQEVFHAINQLAGGSVENVDPGIEKLAALYKENGAKTINNVEHMHQLLLSEEIWIAPHFSARIVKAAEAGAPVEMVVPEEGGLSFIFNTSVLARRPEASTELAFDFVNTTLDPEKQIEFSRLTGYPPTHSEAMANLPADLKHLEMSEEEVAGFGKIQRDFDYMAMFVMRDQIKSRWDTEVLAD